MAHPIVITENMSGTKDGSQLVSFKYIANSAAAEIENGHIVKLDGIANTVDREILKGVDCLANTPLSDIALVAGVELDYDEHKHSLDSFVNPAGRAVRGFRMHPGIFAVSSDAVTAEGTVTAGNLVEVAAGTKMKVVASATANATQIGVVNEVYNAAGKTFYSIEIK